MLKGVKKRSLYTKRPIKKNEELLLDYPKDYNRNWLSYTDQKEK